MIGCYLSVAPIYNAEYQVSVKHTKFHCFFFCMDVFSPTRLQYSGYVDFVTIFVPNIEEK